MAIRMEKQLKKPLKLLDSQVQRVLQVSRLSPLAKRIHFDLFCFVFGLRVFLFLCAPRLFTFLRLSYLLCCWLFFLVFFRFFFFILLANFNQSQNGDVVEHRHRMTTILFVAVVFFAAVVVVIIYELCFALVFYPTTSSCRCTCRALPQAVHL